MNLPPIAGHLTTGDIGLASCLNALGIPPAPDRQIRAVKNADGSDFCRIALGSTSVDGKLQTSELMSAWGKGPEGVRANRATTFALLQCWNKTRGAMFKMRDNHPMVKGLCGGRDVIVESHEVARWLDPGTAAEFRAREDTQPGFAARDAGLAAALIILGGDLLGVDGNGRWIFTMRSLDAFPDARECAAAWPKMVSNTAKDAAYMAAAAANRRVILDVVRAQDPEMMYARGAELGFISEAKYNAGDPGAQEVARLLRL